MDNKLLDEILRCQVIIRADMLILKTRDQSVQIV